MTTTTTITTKPFDIEKLEVPYGRNAILARYEKYGRERDSTCHERAFYGHFKPLAVAQQKSKPRPVKLEVQRITRHKHKGKEYITYGGSLRSTDYRGNKIDFFEDFGKYELPEFTVQTDPDTEEIIPGSSQVDGHKLVYDIPFNKEKVKELLEMASESIYFTVVAPDNRRYSCSYSEFMNMDYDELVNLKSGFTEYLKNKQQAATATAAAR